MLEIRTVVGSGVEVGVTRKEQKEPSGVTEVFCILTEMWVTRVNAFNKTHWLVYLRSMLFTVCKLDLNFIKETKK